MELRLSCLLRGKVKRGHFSFSYGVVCLLHECGPPEDHRDMPRMADGTRE